MPNTLCHHSFKNLHILIHYCDSPHHYLSIQELTGVALGALFLPEILLTSSYEITPLKPAVNLLLIGSLWLASVGVHMCLQLPENILDPV